MQTKKFWTIVVVLILLIGVVYFVFVGFSLGGVYSVVRFSNGETYIGKLSYFPRLYMTEGYRLDTIAGQKAGEKDSFRLLPLRESVWAPFGVYINKSQTTFYGPIRDNSDISKFLNETNQN